MRCPGPICTFRRKEIQREFGRWSKAALSAKGLEAIAEFLLDQLNSTKPNPESNQSERAEEERPIEDFDVGQQSQLCAVCDRHNEFTYGTNQVAMPLDSSTTSTSTTCPSITPPPPSSQQPRPRTSPLDVFRSLSSSDTDASLSASGTTTSPLFSPFSPFGSPLFGNNLPNPYEMMAAGVDVHQLQQLMAAIVSPSPSLPLLPLSPEIQRALIENQASISPGNVPNSQFLWSFPAMMQLQQQMVQEMNLQMGSAKGSTKTKTDSSSSNNRNIEREDSPLDLSSTLSAEGTPLNSEPTVMEHLLGVIDKSERKRHSDNGDKSTSPDSMKNGYMSKRNYSQTDLAAAVDDIRCGKLGTRRASVVYGIPRSTLRNKIYKIEAAEEVAGVVNTSRRRKPGGQSAAEKKMAESIEREKRSISTSSNRLSEERESADATPPAAEGQRNSSCESEQPAEGEASAPLPGSGQQSLFEQLAAGLDLASLSMNGISSLWHNLFNNQPLPFKSDIMNIGSSRHSSQSSTQSQNNSGEDWKKSRPKRGQYRKYDKNALDEAVRSVRRGEMSVHRAGSYFGVPHSTLEYKVKERNLLRKKKEQQPTTTMDGLVEMQQKVAEMAAAAAAGGTQICDPPSADFESKPSAVLLSSPTSSHLPSFVSV